MTRPILIGYDPRIGDSAPVELGAELARLTGAPLVVAFVRGGAPILPVGTPQNDVDYAIGQIEPDLLSEGAPALENVEPKLRALGIKCELRPLQGTSAARAIQAEAERDDAALIVIGSARHTGIGSTAWRLLNGSPCAVSVAPRDWKAESWSRPGGPGTIGVGYVESEEGRHALAAAHALALRAGATLRVITVIRRGFRMALESEPRYVAGQFGKDTEDVEGEYRLEMERRLHGTADELGHDVEVELETLVGDPAEVLVDASRSVDLLVCGSRGYGPLRGVLLGSVTRHLVGESHCPVVVLPRGVKDSLEALLETAPGAAARA
jgi:nucleotide-binding universal stress UspA family protein